MEIREFFTIEEINSMKKRIIKECSLTNFLVKTEYTNEDGDKETYKSLTPDIKSVIKNETDRQIKEYVKQVINETVRDKIQIAVEKFSKNLCDQLEKITTKTNWYWSIK